MKQFFKFKKEDKEIQEDGTIKKDENVKEDGKEKEPVSVVHRVLTVVGIVMCVILIPLLISNIVLIIQNYLHKDEVPSLFSISPMIVMTDSMEPKINGGDLIFVKKVAPEDVACEDIIAFFDPASKNKNSVVTHRVKEIIVGEDGSISFRTKGDANNMVDRELVPADKMIGRYTFRLRGVGSLALFMQTTVGLIVCVIIPLFLLIAYDVIRRRIYEKKKQEDTDVLLAELAALKAEKSNKITAEKSAADQAMTDEAMPENAKAETSENSSENK